MPAVPRNEPPRAMSSAWAEVVFADIDDTLVLSAGAKRLLIKRVAKRVAALKEENAVFEHD